MPRPKNKVSLVGRVSGEPKVKRLPSGDEVVEIRLVVDRDNRSGVDTLDVASWSAQLKRRTLTLKRSRVDFCIRSNSAQVLALGSKVGQSVAGRSART